ncbi:MAG: hypothetical protein KKE50_06355 [Nanoarchaeota archaeon]|nr:hypothetical protein [Nanoarchaeota archaeon]
MADEYLLRLCEKEDGTTVDVSVQGVVPRVGEDIRIVLSDNHPQRYYKITRVLHTLNEEMVEGVDKRGKAEKPQVYAHRTS